MAYDEVLAERVRELSGLPEKRMFGGAAFMLDGNMAVGIIGDDLAVRVPRDEYEAALTEPGARPFDFTGKPMTGWLMVAGEVLDDEVLAAWVSRSMAYAGSLPTK